MQRSFDHINNQATKPFELHRGVCQGCHLAPYLFIITGEALSNNSNALGIGNIKGVILPQCNSQEIITQYVDDMSFMIKTEENSVDNLVGILHKFGIASRLEINWHNNVANWCGRERPPRWVKKYQWKWAATGDLPRLLSTPFGLQLEVHDVDQFLKNMVKGNSSIGALQTCYLQGKPSS